MTGNVEMVLDTREGKIIQRFSREMLEVIYDPGNAMEVAMELADMASDLMDNKRTIPGAHTGTALKHELIERHRMTLTKRIAIVITSWRNDKNMTDGQVAKQIVDICFSEIF